MDKTFSSGPALHSLIEDAPTSEDGARDLEKTVAARIGSRRGVYAAQLDDRPKLFHAALSSIRRGGDVAGRQ